MDVEMETNGHPPGFGSSAERSTQPETLSFEASNSAATSYNAADSSLALPRKPEIDVAPPHEALQPVRDIAPTFEERTLEPTAVNGVSEVSDNRAADLPVNGTSLDAKLNQATHELPSATSSAPVTSEPIPTHEAAPLSSTLTAPVEMDTSAPISVLQEAQPAGTSLVSEIPAEISQAPIHADQAPISDLRTSPPLEAVSAETALRIKNEKEQQDLAADSAIADTLATHDDGPMVTETEPEPAPAPESVLTTAMDVSEDAPAVDSAQVPSPPPAPRPTAATLPANSQPEPKEPAPTPAEPAHQLDSHTDHQMLDAPSPPTKISREREDDTDTIEPAAKRTKTENDESVAEFKVPDVPQTLQSPAQDQEGASLKTEDSIAVDSKPVATSDVQTDEADTITPPRLAHMKKIISNLKKGSSSIYFRTPVDYVALNIPNYPTVVKHPMDLGTIDTKLKGQSYPSVKKFVHDFELIVHNTSIFNGPEHLVTQTAKKMQSSFNNQMANMPGVSVAEPSKEEKKAQKVKEQPTRVPPARRPSNPVPAASPTTTVPSSTARASSTSGSAQTFALNPEGVPLIRRDSTAVDGRPKRAIKPTRTHDIGGVRPKKKKYELELRFCQEVLSELRKPKHWMSNQYFMVPVDPIALQIPTYFQIIRKPMDLSTVQNKLEANEYEKAKDFEEDVRLVFRNCYKFNKPGDVVYSAGQSLEKLFNEQWEKMGQWLADKQPTSEPPSPVEDEEDEVESEEEEEDDSDDERQEKIAQLQRQMEAMSKHMSELAQPKKKKKSTPPTVPTKKGSKSKSGKKEKQPPTFPALQAKKEKKSIKAKPEKERYVSYNEKQYISNGITQLDERRMNEALRIIQTNVPSLRNTDQTEIELDIDELPNHVLLKLLNFLKKHVPQAPPEPPSEPAFTPAVAPSKPKKNKPMTKHEQEAQIEELRGKLGAYNGGPVSPDAAPTIEKDDSSGDEDDSEESEEE